MIYFNDLVIQYGEIDTNDPKTSSKFRAICKMIKYYLGKKDYIKAREYIIIDSKYSCKECINQYLSTIFDLIIAANHTSLLNNTNLRKLVKNLEYYGMINVKPLKMDMDNKNIVPSNEEKFKEECFICCENSYPIILSCDHKVCINCYPTIENRKCPYCRKSI